ncbi:HAMP domain-containing histidine kinase [Nostoc sp. CENA67]|uniref:histidine kinase n=1 Tax=Amazonocrinis nigriterrae CENA67 TaxID=2794033 RepID=A0A8J7HRG0_9NOST|nr:two-component system sensor histidine kinase RppB [Amazonocrinis nigriterrae]MBH8564596.1 HAMP domain-containing histidine kinase [Amazonocrinis nigriterrae CENA67]
MERNELFYVTRLRLAGWYALVMGCILGVSGLGIYQVVAHAYHETIDEGLESVTKALHKSIEPVSGQPKQLKQLAKELSLNVCLTQANCLLSQTAKIQHPLTEVADPVTYYLRLLDQSKRPLTIAGVQLEQLPIASPEIHRQTLTDKSGIRYRQISLTLRTQYQLTGYVQVGRSLKDLDQHLAALRLALLLGWPVTMIVIAICSWYLAGLAMQPVYRSYQQMEQFTADAAHEFRTPLAAMHSTIDAAFRLYGQSGSELLTEPVNRTLQVLKRQTARLSKLVGDLLLLARLDQQQLAGEYQPCCLNDLISDLVEELAFLATEAQVKLIQQVQSPKKLYVLGNEEQLYRLISNLMINAIQATPSEGQVTVALEHSERCAFIIVQDTGIGIAPEHHSQIFNRFYRINKDRSRASGGSGLGLAIASAIARTHKGSIQLYSQINKGSTFTVKLPLQQ